MTPGVHLVNLVLLGQHYAELSRSGSRLRFPMTGKCLLHRSLNLSACAMSAEAGVTDRPVGVARCWRFSVWANA